MRRKIVWGEYYFSLISATFTLESHKVALIKINLEKWCLRIIHGVNAIITHEYLCLLLK